MAQYLLVTVEAGHLVEQTFFLQQYAEPGQAITGHTGQQVMLEVVVHKVRSHQKTLPHGRFNRAGIETGIGVICIGHCRVLRDLSQSRHQHVRRHQARKPEPPSPANAQQHQDTGQRRLHSDLLEQQGFAIRAAATKPFGFVPYYPGPGLGGHCIPIDPFYLTWKAREYGLHTRFIELAGEVNRSMPRYVVEGVTRALNDQGKPVRGSRICLLGVAYKKNIDDPRESPAFELFDLLGKAGALLSYNDPHVPKLPPMRHHNVPDLTSQELTSEYLASQDCVLISTDHSVYDFTFIVEHAPLVIDTRNACHDVVIGREKIFKC